MITIYKNVSDIAAHLLGKDFSKKFETYCDERKLIKHLILLRQKYRLTQKELAKKMKCTQSKVSNIEYSLDRNLKIKDLVGYAKALNLQLKIEFI
jgi:transcriptional regulator